MPSNRKREVSGIYDVNMTPLIDVSLVLVVILMVATPMALQSSIGVQRSGTKAAAAPAEQPERVEIQIVSEDSVLVNRMSLQRGALPGVLRPLLAGRPQRQVVVHCAPSVTHGSFVSVLDAAKECGAEQIAVLGR